MHAVSDAVPSRARGAAHTHIRTATQNAHTTVDDAFSRFDLGDPISYGAFLSAHARALPAIELAVAPESCLPNWTARAGLLMSDLAALHRPPPPEAPFELPLGDGARWGALYALEGSRLGGAVLARQVGAGLPVAYLSAVHAPGGWKAVLATIEHAASGSKWLKNAVAGANAVFTAYQRAAEEECRRGR